IRDPELEVAMAALPLAAAVPRTLGASGRESAAPGAEASLGAGSAVLALAERLQALAADPDAALEARLDAVDALLGLPARGAAGVEAGARFLDPYFPLAAQSRAIDALASALDDAHSGPAAAAALAAAFRGLSPAARERVFHHLV